MFLCICGTCCQNSEFANEFIKKNGIEVIIDLINKSTGNTVAYALAALQNLMTKDVGWGSLSQEFIIKVCHRFF